MDNFDYIICNCKKVSYGDVEKVMIKNNRLKDVEEAFSEVQRETKCSTGCGGCYERILDAIADVFQSK